VTAAPWLHVVGIGDGGIASLGEPARAALAAAEVIVGGERHLAMVPDHPGERLLWRRPIEATLVDL
jgi:precorrin-6B C5,15-methyltransferase / cobalt-precorrin-6B C5,C15-methyltransferase